MIAIINLGTNLNPDGIHEYVVKINTDEICRFTHKREEGLGQCLRRAAMAVDNARANDGKEYTRYLLNMGRKT